MIDDEEWSLLIDLGSSPIKPRLTHLESGYTIQYSYEQFLKAVKILEYENIK